VLGGGGYTVRNVARCWTYETSVLLGVPIANDLPYNDFFEYYAPDFKLHLTASTTMENQNKRDTLEQNTMRIIQNLKNLQHAPSVQMNPVPPDHVIRSQQTLQEMEDANPDKRLDASYNRDGSMRREDERELYDNERDVDHVDNDEGEVDTERDIEEATKAFDAVENTAEKEVESSREVGTEEVMAVEESGEAEVQMDVVD